MHAFIFHKNNEGKEEKPFVLSDDLMGRMNVKTKTVYMRNSKRLFIKEYIKS